MRAHISPLNVWLSLALWLALALLYLLDTPTCDVARADIFGGLLIGTIAGFVTRLLSNDPGNTGASVGRAIINLQKDLGGVGGALKDFVGEMRGWLGGLVGLLKAFKESALIPMLRWLRDHIAQLKAWLKKIFKPLIDNLLLIRKHLLRIYNKFVRPVLEVINVIRFITGTLSRLGVKWAQELDLKLAQIERAIVRNFQTILQHLNRVIDVVDSVVTFDILFQRIPFLRTLVRDAAYLNRIWWHINLDEIEDPGGPGDDGELEPRPIAEDIGELRDFLRTGGGAKAAIIGELRAIALAAAEGRST